LLIVASGRYHSSCLAHSNCRQRAAQQPHAQGKGSLAHWAAAQTTL